MHVTKNHTAEPLTCLTAKQSDVLNNHTQSCIFNINIIVFQHPVALISIISSTYISVAMQHKNVTAKTCCE
jgi:hypothetical protein